METIRNISEKLNMDHHRTTYMKLSPCKHPMCSAFRMRQCKKCTVSTEEYHKCFEKYIRPKINRIIKEEQEKQRSEEFDRLHPNLKVEYDFENNVWVWGE